jgi:hypothetical protein
VIAACDVCGQDMARHVGCIDPAFSMPHEGPERCRDCLTPHGGLHHRGCLVARCDCGAQAVMCDLDDHDPQR